MTTQTEQIPGYLAGTWAIDPVHSDVSFVVRHLGVSKVRGHFDTFEGTIVTAENPLESTVTAKIATASINTKNAQRDAHVKNEDFLDVENHPELTFTSTGVRAHGEGYLVDGQLTLRGVTKPVTLELELNGFGDGMAEGSKVAGFSASTEISRKDFGVTGGPAGAAVGDKITILLEIEATLQS
ncbi:YceI family protein [Saccharothrix australiensis]|uniref:Polyisoprenoid-binding protein YceI n=1 Tax=Saccharothrix australiensis TaxID=2072 RepID=A0A495W2L4_9PSEU|nr:YceI family protein [Saccharothrix australiensis]RKT55876.1 polyisoprenoid-binding protein YceI [Saccharothrix australiensis]